MVYWNHAAWLIAVGRNAGAGLCVARTCVFCGGSPVTKEHVLAEWISNALAAGRGPGLQRFTGKRQLGRFRAPQPPQDDPAPTRIFDQQVRKYCKPCNNGWMSSLEAAVRPLLEPMFWGKQVELATADQTLVARWATKTAVVAQSIDPPPDRRPVIQAEWLRTGTGPAPSTLVGLGIYDGPRHAMALRVQAHRAEPAGIGPATCADELVVVWLEHLVIVVYLWDGPVDAQAQMPPQFGHRLIQVWPTSPLIRVWPPSGKLGDTDLVTVQSTPPLIRQTVGV
jgi:hypothetical protein